MADLTFPADFNASMSNLLATVSASALPVPVLDTLYEMVLQWGKTCSVTWSTGVPGVWADIFGDCALYCQHGGLFDPARATPAVLSMIIAITTFTTFRNADGSWSPIL